MKRSLSRNDSRTGSKPRIERRVALARAALLWERFWGGTWPASGIAMAFIAAALFGLFTIVPGWLHALILAGVLFALALALYAGFSHFIFPRWSEGARRLERDNALVNRPVSESDDKLAAGEGDAYAEELWAAHMRRVLGAFGALKLNKPKPGLWRRDPYGIRFAALALLIGAVFVAGNDWSNRLLGSLSPRTFSGASVPTLDAWVDPPAYTGEAPIYLTQNSKTVTAPQNSQVHFRVHNSGTRPRASIDPSQDVRFAGQSGEYSATVKLAKSSDFSVRADGLRIGSWSVKIVRDEPPVIAFANPPSKTPQNALKLSFTAGDDYGVVAARAIITPVGRKAKPLPVDLPLSDTSAKTVSQTIYRDLTDHPYAGMDVNIVLEARDAAGNKGLSKPARFKLPARLFTNPLSRALIEQRQILASGEDKVQDKVADALDALTLAPEHFYQGKSGVYLAIRAARWATKTASRPEEFQHAEDLLWQTALAIEQGGLTLAAAELRRLQQALTEALARGAPQDEIDALLQRYREALQRYMRFMAENAKPGGGPLPPNTKVLSQDDLETLLKAIEQLAQTGARDQAAQMLAMLQNMLENMQMTAGQGGGGKAGQSPEDKAMSDAIGKLGDLMGKQRALLDKTLRQQEGVPDPKDGGPKGLAKKQGELRDALKDIQKGLGAQNQKPDNLGRAGNSMGNAQNQLGSEDMESASGSQKNALDALRSGADQLAKALMNRQGQGMPGRSGQEDPLGREEGGTGAMFGNNVKVPDKMTLERARSILKELRRRAAERGRPKEELDYIDRLLKEF
jgi:uncharacterized protein (TIGR02302 family)